MLRPALMIPVLAASLALAAPAAADGAPDAYREAPAGHGGLRAGEVPHRPVARHARRHHRLTVVRLPGTPVGSVPYGETDGTVFHAWLPRNTNLPIYNIPPPYFPEP